MTGLKYIGVFLKLKLRLLRTITDQIRTGIPHNTLLDPALRLELRLSLSESVLLPLEDAGICHTQLGICVFFFLPFKIVSKIETFS